ncbi:hypothetical protein [Sphingobium estronivorans]|uniref:hypothetical protein n=1 Tax=Sphingobium estronivorans TaxID=1577690 RepID=UPI00123A0CFC|nr:hypothetical protein [Sphingobium estronivorans]
MKTAIIACMQANAPDRHLDGKIALAIFPALAELPMIAEGVWRQDDGTHARALRYSASRTAAATLVPAGGWIEKHGREVHVCGEDGEWTGTHRIEAIALCIAALSARLANYVEQNY